MARTPDKSLVTLAEAVAELGCLESQAVGARRLVGHVQRLWERIRRWGGRSG